MAENKDNEKKCYSIIQCDGNIEGVCGTPQGCENLTPQGAVELFIKALITTLGNEENEN